MIIKTDSELIKSFKDDIKNDKEVELHMRHFDIYETSDDESQKITLILKDFDLVEDMYNRDKMKITDSFRYLLQDKLYSDSKYLEIESDNYYNIIIVLEHSLEYLKKTRKMYLKKWIFNIEKNKESELN